METLVQLVIEFDSHLSPMASMVFWITLQGSLLLYAGYLGNKIIDELYM